MSATQSAIYGTGVLLEGLVDGDFIPFACATAVELYVDTEMIERAGLNLNSMRGYVAGLGDWGLTFNSVTNVLPSTAMITVFDTMVEALRKNGLYIRLSFEDNSGNLKVITGHVLIPHTGIASPIDGFSEDTIERKGDGPFAINTTLIDPAPTTGVQDPIDYTATGGETDITYPALIGRTLLYVGVDGIDHEVITVGTPNDKQVKFDSATGKITFPSALMLDMWVHILYK
jgi:hypothetical protein